MNFKQSLLAYTLAIFSSSIFSQQSVQLLNPGERVTCVVKVSEFFSNGVGKNKTNVSNANPVIHEINGNRLKAYYPKGSPSVAYDGAELVELKIEPEGNKRYAVNVFSKQTQSGINSITFFREVNSQNKPVGQMMQWNRFSSNGFASYGEFTSTCE